MAIDNAWSMASPLFSIAIVSRRQINNSDRQTPSKFERTVEQITSAVENHPPPYTYTLLCLLYFDEVFRKVCTKRQNELQNEVWILLSQSSTEVPSLLPCAMLPRRPMGICKKTVYKTYCTVHFVS